MVAALVISNLATMLVIWLLYQESYSLFDRGTARRSVLYLLGFPVALFLVGAHSESVFMAFPWQVHARVWGDHNAWPWDGAIHNLLTILGYYPLRNLSMFSLSQDLLSVALFLTLAIAAARVLPTEHVLLMGALLFVALVRVDGYGWMRATSRFMLPIFPSFVVLAGPDAGPPFIGPGFPSFSLFKRLHPAYFSFGALWRKGGFWCTGAGSG